MKTRYATSADIPGLVSLINQAYRVEDFFVNGNRTNAEDIGERLAAPGAGFIVIDAPDSTKLVGAVWVEVHGDRGHFALLSVDPAFQGKGLGQGLIAAVEDHCRARQCRELDLEVVNLRLELPPYYAKYGFASCGKGPFTDPAKLTRDAHLILMTKQLEVENLDG